MIGQRHYVILKESSGRAQFWRGKRGLPDSETGWTFDLSAARSYRRGHDALRAAKQLDESSTIEVVEVESVVARVCYRVAVETVDQKK